MAKKRKSNTASRGRNQAEPDPNKRVRLDLKSYQDVAGSDDEFQIGRDEVLLEEPAAEKRARKIREEEEFLEDSAEEVLGYSDEDDELDADSEDEEGEKGLVGRDAAGVDSEDNDEDLDQEEDEINDWGDSRQDFYGADAMETEQDALDEEAEATRLQKKQLEALSAADYGFDEDEWAGESKQDQQHPVARGKTVTEVLPQLVVSEDLGSAERLKLLKSRYPEFEPLRKEFLDLEEELAVIKEAQPGVQQSDSTYRDDAADTRTNKERVASAYLATLTVYFALLTSSIGPSGTVVVSPTDLREHPVMESLLSLRLLWQRVRNLSDIKPLADADLIKPSKATKPDIARIQNHEPEVAQQRRRARASKTKSGAQATKQKAEAKRSERLAAVDADLADLDDLLTRKPRKPTRRVVTGKGVQDAIEDADLGEEELSERAVAEKAAKRRSLRFYTSQIAQKSNKRGTAGRNTGGDDDIPYKERFRDRQARLTAEAAKRGARDNAGAELGGESGSEDEAQAKAIRADAAGDDDNYYQYISGKKASKKNEKEALAEARKQAILDGGRVVEQEEVGPDGKRRITYAIEKNKGLTPHRKKDVRNPRVKKRKKFDEKKKKLATMRPVYKGGEGKGGYGGELSGIKSNLVKSRKL